MRRPPIDLAQHMAEKARRDANEQAYRAVLARFETLTIGLGGGRYSSKPARERLLDCAHEDYVAGRVTLEQLEARVEYALTR